MELRQIRYFTVLADELSFTRAARRLHISQPPLSFQIASLEVELGARLFDRTSRSVALSAAGQAFLPHAQAVLARLDEARSHVTRVANGLEGRVKVGLAGSHFLGPFPQFIQQFRLQRPDVDVALNEMKPSDHLQALRDGQLDLCVSRNPLNDGQISAALLWRDPVVVACRRVTGWQAAANSVWQSCTTRTLCFCDWILRLLPCACLMLVCSPALRHALFNRWWKCPLR